MTTKTWARLTGGVVAELWTGDTGLVPGRDVPSYWTDDVTSVSGIAVGWTKSGGTFSAPPTVAPTAASLTAYANSAFDKTLAAGQNFNVAASGASAVPILCDGTGPTMGNLAVLTLYGQENPNGTKTWLDNNGVATVVTGSQFITLTTLVGTWSDDLYAALGTVFAGINASPATMTSTAQIDAAFAAVTS